MQQRYLLYVGRELTVLSATVVCKFICGAEEPLLTQRTLFLRRGDAQDVESRLRSNECMYLSRRAESCAARSARVDYEISAIP